ncbi:DUF6276 family protein [Halobellus sp. GM3]|uniref:DUF6276 family protein n=1 Tax=Halobellus sp. GM3 TaxID=3458410 RepID=UPI00403E214D
MSEHCPNCDRPLVGVDVPDRLRAHSPDGAAVVECCPRCLRTYAAADDAVAEGGGEAADLPEAIPDGDGGAALILLLGRLDSLATDRRAIQSLVEYAEATGADVFLALDRLAADGSVEAHADLERRRRQLESLLDY